MASISSETRPVLGRVDSKGRLISADPQLERLQVEAGSRIGATLALPQLAGVARVAQRLRIPVSRRILAAGGEQDIDMWVRAVPEGDEVALSIEQWTSRPASAPRLAAISTIDDEALTPEPLAWSVDEQLRLISISPPFAGLLELEVQDAAGQSLTKLFRLEEDEEGQMPLLDALASRSEFSGQKVSVRSTGQELIFDGTAILGPDGVFAGFEGSATVGDAPVAAADRPALDPAVQTALRSPLDRIVQSAEEMSASTDSSVSEDYVAYAADIAAAARHLLSVIRSLGEQSDSQGGGQVDLAELANEAVGLVETAARERGIFLALERVGSLPARGESRSIVQILVNLAGNAVRHAAPGTAVKISFERSDHAAMVHVADDGPGIEPADQERIFEPFQKGAQEGEGSGLGLAIARRLARAMGGEIQLRSAPGEGSRFTLVLAAA